MKALNTDMRTENINEYVRPASVFWLKTKEHKNVKKIEKERSHKGLSRLSQSNMKNVLPNLQYMNMQ